MQFGQISVHYGFTVFINSNNINNIKPLTCQDTDSKKLQVPLFLS